MIKLENSQVFGWEHAIRGARNPMNSWDRMDSSFNADWSNCEDCRSCDEWGTACKKMGPNDYKLLSKLTAAGSDHGKFMRMIVVYVDITAPLYWWKEFDTYKVGTVANSCSTMHKIHDKWFDFSDFSTEHLHSRSMDVLIDTIKELNFWRDVYLNGSMVDNGDGTTMVYEPRDKEVWWQMIQLLPTSYNQKRTVMLNYEVLKNMYHARKNHKLNEWHVFCDWVETLPYSELITGVSENVDKGNSNGEGVKEK